MSFESVIYMYIRLCVLKRRSATHHLLLVQLNEQRASNIYTIIMQSSSDHHAVMHATARIPMGNYNISIGELE